MSEMYLLRIGKPDGQNNELASSRTRLCTNYFEGVETSLIEIKCGYQILMAQNRFSCCDFLFIFNLKSTPSYEISG